MTGACIRWPACPCFVGCLPVFVPEPGTPLIPPRRVEIVQNMRMIGFRLLFSVLIVQAAIPLTVIAAGPEVFRVGSYNLENLFDLSLDQTEYPGYIPADAGGRYGWDADMLSVKIRNLSRVLADLNADVVALQEVESLEALGHLQDALRGRGVDYPWAAVTEKDETAVRCAILSRYPITASRDIVVPGNRSRNILRADLDIDGARLVLFVNHWPSRNGPESRRIVPAEILFDAVSGLPEGTDYILLGDFNANYNEFAVISEDDRLNDTGGRTGINHVLGTIAEGQLVDRQMIGAAENKHLHYNLWLEVEPSRRWSYLFFGKPRTLDHILLPPAFFDGNGISYIDRSFDRFDPHYLFQGNRIYRWQRANRGRGRHLGKGFSDHLPIYACFATDGFKPADPDRPCYPEPVSAAVADLYNTKTGKVRYRIENAVVVYRHKNNAVIKQKDGRAIYVYRAGKRLEKGGSYSLVVNQMNRYYGNLQITGFESIRKEAAKTDWSALILQHDYSADLSAPNLENEVLGEITGTYDNGRLRYAPGKSIRLFFRDQSLTPEEGGPVRIRNARIGHHREPEIIIERKGQIQRIEP